MPLYEYQCDSCEHRFEVIQKFSDARIEVCPKCGSAVRKLFSSPAIQFKGSGWYITDYAKKSGAPGDSAKGESGGEKSGESKSSGESSGGSKGETKGESKAGSESKSSNDSSTPAAPTTPKAS